MPHERDQSREERREGELRATSDLMLEMVDRLRQAETAKRRLVPGSAEFAREAYEVVVLARTVTRWAELELRQANELGQAAGGGEPSLDATPKRRLDEVLAEWRQAEIRLSQVPPGSRSASEASADAERLRLEYRELQAQKHADHADHPDHGGGRG